MTFSLKKVFGIGSSRRAISSDSLVSQQYDKKSPSPPPTAVPPNQFPTIQTGDTSTASTIAAAESALTSPSPTPPNITSSIQQNYDSYAQQYQMMLQQQSPHGYQKQIKLDDFEVFRTLGTGSFGRVSLVMHRPTQQYYAMKKLRKADVVRLKQVEHTNNERFLLSQVDHPFVVRMVCTFQDDRHLYIILEYVNGGELFSLLRKVRTLPPFVAQFYAAEVILAIEYLHSRDIIYRDLKPENLLLSADGHVKLTDFGFAKVVPQLTWTLCGTPDYLAPEIVLSQGYGKAVDWYAVGVLIYEMLLGSPPFYHESQMKLYENIVNNPPRFPVGFDVVARDLVERLLEKDPAKRLGVLSGGAQDVKSHPWFRDVKWDALYQLRIRSPYKPKVSHTGDTSNFDHYPEEDPAAIDQSIDPSEHADLFPGF